MVNFGQDLGQKEDISWAVRTNVGFAGDKCWIFKTDIGQMFDEDKVKTFTGLMLDKIWIWDKGWTKVGIRTLSTSTPISKWLTLFASLQTAELAFHT